MLTCVVVAIAAFASLQRFGLRATLLIVGGVLAMLLAPLLPVSLQVGPTAPTEIRLLTMIWYFLAFCTAIALHFIRQKSSVWTASISGVVVVAILTWNTMLYLNHSALAKVERQFDGFTRYVIDQTPCNLIDEDGWSSWTHDLYVAIWPGVAHPVIAPEEIIDVMAAPGSKICRYDGSKMVVAGTVERTTACDMNAALKVDLHYDGTHIDFAFGPVEGAPYYFEVPGKYFLKLPSRFTGPLPDTARFENFKVLRILKDKTVTCSPVLHFVPAREPSLHWQR